MDITSVSGSGFALEPLKSKKTKSEPDKVGVSKDRLEISDEAVSLFQTSENKRLEEIRNKIESGYYFQRDVTETVVDAMMRDLGLT
jgi:anti-sigma28 factor (negative regulator of flagellin synthesis)